MNNFQVFLDVEVAVYTSLIFKLLKATLSISLFSQCTWTLLYPLSLVWF